MRQMHLTLITFNISSTAENVLKIIHGKIMISESHNTGRMPANAVLTRVIYPLWNWPNPEKVEKRRLVK